MKPLASLVCAAVLGGRLFISTLPAAEAAFSEDGKTVYACANDGGKLWQVVLADGKTTVLDLSPQLQGDGITAISVATDGRLWLATPKKLFLWKPSENSVTKVLDLEHGEFTDINANPATGDLLVQTFGGEEETDDGLHLKVLPKGQTDLAEAAESPAMLSFVFVAEGRLFFSHAGDLWAGLANVEGEAISLSVWRAAPLALPQYDAGNEGSSFTLMDVAPAGKSLVLSFANEVESFLVQMPKPAVHLGPEGPLEKLPVGVAANWKQAASALQSLKVIATGDAVSTLFNLCSSADESKVFFLAHSEEDGKKTFRLLDVKTGKIRVLGEAPGEGAGSNEAPKSSPP